MGGDRFESTEQQSLHTIAIIVILLLVSCAAFFFWWRKSPSETHVKHEATNLLRSPRACAVLALDDNTSTTVSKSATQTSIFYSTDDSMIGKARARGWNVVKLPGAHEEALKQIRYLPFSLFDVGLKYATTLFIGNGARAPDMDKLGHLINVKHRDKGVLIFGDPNKPTAVFALVQDKKVRRALYNLAEHQIKLPASMSLNLPSSRIFP
jgi:hypothetical protein